VGRLRDDLNRESSFVGGLGSQETRKKIISAPL
jgi:hypothetical protein